MKRPGWLLAAAALTLGFAPLLRADPAAPAAAPSGTPQERLQRRLERLRERAAALPSTLPKPLSSTEPRATPAPSGSSSPDPSDLIRSELQRKWAALTATRVERRERHRAALVTEVGQRLSDPAVQAELQLHAMRVAELARMQFLAQNARSGAARDKLLARLTKLSEREAARHRRQLAALLAKPPAAPSAAAPAPSAPPAAPSSEAPR